LGEEWTMRFATLDYWPTQDFYEVPIAPAINADGRTINRNQGGNIVRRERELQNHFYQFDLAGTQKFDRVVVKPLFSVDYGIDIDANRRSRSSTAFAPLDLFTPNYSAVLPSDFAFLSDQETTTHQWAGTAMIQAEFLDERVIFTAGLRGTDFFQKTKNRVTGASSPKVNGKFETVPRYGIVVRPVRDVSLYYGYGEAFQALTTVNPDGVGFDAIRGEQHEVGVKTELFAGKLALTVAVFRLDRVNALESDPTRPGFQIPSGGQRAEGYDLSAILSLTQDWQVIAGYAHTEAEVKSAINQINVGLTLTGVPQDYANIWTRYRFSEGPVKGLAIGLGAVSASSNPVLVPNNPAAARLSLPSYNTFDAMLSYDVSTKLRFQLNVRNLTDERYYPQGTATNLSLGDARTFSLTTTYRF
jgi:outer membrane receptor protein involved in Fe transport